MLVLLSFVLVLVATVLLVLGLLGDDGLTLIYLSIASSVAAAAVLVVALRSNKPKAADILAASTALPVLTHETVEPATDDATEIAPAADADAWLASDQAEWSDSAAAVDVDELDEGEEVDFPIADYDTLTVGQILPLLPQLYADEIDVVEERERLTKARPQVLAKLAELRDAPSVSDPLASYTEATSASDDWDDEDWFPIEDYEVLSAAQILPLLPELDDEELMMVRTRELSLGRRRSLLDEIDRALGVTPAPEPEPAPPTAPKPRAATVKPAPARKAAAPSKPAGAKKAAATKKGAAAPSVKVAASAKKPPAAGKAAPAKGVAPVTSAATGKTSATKKAATKKSTAPATKQAAAPIAKTAATRKTTAPVAKTAATKTAATKKAVAPAAKAPTTKRAAK